MENLFASPEKERTFKTLLRDLVPEPFVIHLLNKNASPEKISLFNKDEPLNPKIFVGSGIPQVSYNEITCLFMYRVDLGLCLVRVIAAPNVGDILNTPITFLQKDGRGNCSAKPVHFNDDDTALNINNAGNDMIFFRETDAIMSALTYINLTMPPFTEIELHLFEKRRVGKA